MLYRAGQLTLTVGGNSSILKLPSDASVRASHPGVHSLGVRFNLSWCAAHLVFCYSEALEYRT